MSKATGRPNGRPKGAVRSAPEKPCPFCGELFRARQKHCSPLCRVASGQSASIEVRETVRPLMTSISSPAKLADRVSETLQRRVSPAQVGRALAYIRNVEPRELASPSPSRAKATPAGPAAPKRVSFVDWPIDQTGSHGVSLRATSKPEVAKADVLLMQAVLAGQGRGLQAQEGEKKGKARKRLTARA